MPSDPDPSAARILGQLIWLAVLILVNAFFAMSEIAVISVSDAKLERLAAQGDKRAVRLRKLTLNASRFLSTIQIGVTLAGFLASSSAAQSFGEMLTGTLIPLAPRWAGLLSGAATVLVTLVMSYLSLVFGELVPKRLAMTHPERISLRVSGVLLFFSRAFRPLVFLVSSSTNSILRLLGIDPNQQDASVTEEEIRLMVEAGGERGVIEDSQKEMIDNIFEFDDISAADIMTHRTEIVGVESGEPLDKVIAAAMEEGYSRIPVYEEDLDTIIGVVYVKDLLRFVGAALPQESGALRRVMREAYYVPETMRCGPLFQEMTAKHLQIAVVVDEYGGTAGIVTLEDVLESIVGNIQDEYDDEEEEISRIDERTFLLDGAADIEELGERLNITLPHGEYDTVAGFVLQLLGYLPQEGETPQVRFQNLLFTVLGMEDRRITQIKAELQDPPVPEGK
ncbi:MAG: hemolysin family protein [Oscillospiraceae bacterium]|jgi:putative hemolysin|nr:hemolysin family protein [Oscillospiraceae bacterium]